eukprot:13425-Heterococcus_DN1.PRE.2
MEGMAVVDVVCTVKPHALLGLSGAGRIWSGATLQALGEGCDRPLIVRSSTTVTRLARFQ